MSALAVFGPAWSIAVHEQPVQSIAFNPNGRLIATGDVTRHLKAWHRNQPFFETDLSRAADKPRNSDRLRSVAFSPNGRLLYVVCGDRLRAFDILQRIETWTFQPRRLFGLLAVSPVALAISPAGNVITATDHGHVVAFDPNGRRIARWADNEAPRHAAFMSDGTSIVGVDGFTLCVWDAYSGVKRQRIKLNERIFGLAHAALADVIAVRTLHTIDLYSARTMEKTLEILAPTGLPAVALTQEGSIMALAGRDEIHLMRLSDESTTTLALPQGRVLSLAFSPDGSFLAAGCSDGVVRCWDLSPDRKHADDDDHAIPGS